VGSGGPGRGVGALAVMGQRGVGGVGGVQAERNAMHFQLYSAPVHVNVATANFSVRA
jgi:hypothetical protein